MSFQNPPRIHEEPPRLHHREVPHPKAPCPYHRVLERELQALRDLLEVAHNTVVSQNIGDVLPIILRDAMRLLRVPAGSIALYDSHCQVMELEVHAGLSNAFVAKNRWRVKQGGLTHRILIENEMLVIEDTARATFFTNPLVHAEGIRSLIAIPLRSQRRLVGILYLNDFKRRVFPEELVRLLPIFASLAAMCIDNARLFANAQRLACLDGLTELYNRRQLEKALVREVDRAHRHGTPFTIVMLDLDDFKRINDRYGHSTGDRVLREVAEAFRQATRDSDIPCRYGGDEFVAILPGVRPAEGRELASRVCRQIGEHLVKVLHKDGIEPPTLSAGIVSFPENGSNASELLDRVDTLLFEAKRSGKDRIVALGA